MAMSRTPSEPCVAALGAAAAARRPTLARLLASARRRREQRGAAVFLVVMVMTIAAAIGIFSMHSASLADLAVGYARQSTQAALIAEYAARATANDVERTPTLADSTIQVENCAPALVARDPDAPCYVFKTTTLEDALKATWPSQPPGSFFGQLGTDNGHTRIDAELVTEMTEPSTANLRYSPGFSTGTFRQVTFTSFARVYPTDINDLTSTGVCSNAAHGAVSQQIVRTHVIVPR
jgi:hypothetical protein